MICAEKLNDTKSSEKGPRGGSEETTPASQMRILLADDHTLFRKGLTYILDELGSDVEVVEAGSFAEVETACEQSADFDLILLDLRMPGMSDMRSVEHLTATLPETPIVVISALEDRSNVFTALEAGAAGYIPKTLSSDVLLSALRLVLAGGIFIPQSILSTAGSVEGRYASEHTARHAAGDRDLLTPRQLEVLQLLARGKANKEIARELDLAVGTVKLHVTALLKALGATNRTQAVIKAAALGILEREDAFKE